MATTVSLKPNAVEISGSTSGTTTLQATAVAGTTTLTLPAATDTLVGKATTDTLTNKTLTSPTITGVATFAAGTAAAPAITTTGDTNTGIWFPAADTIAFTEGGVESMRIDSSGNLGLGVTPSAWSSSYKALETGSGSLVYPGTATNTQLWNNLYVNTSGNVTYKTTGIGGLYSIGGGGNAHTWYYAASGTAGATATLTQAMTLDTSGNLLVGDTSTAAGERLRVVGSVGNHLCRFVNTKGTTLIYGPQIAYSAISPNDTGNEFITCVDSTATRMTLRSNGGIANYTANDVNLSDRREKTNFAPAKSYLDVICAIPVQTFNYIDQSEDDPGLTLGVVAQDVQAVAPELVMESNWAGKDEEPKMRLSIYQTDLQYALMKCIQEQQALIITLTARISALESA
jgi:hypothetical protein